MPIQFETITLNGNKTNRGTASWTRGDGGFTASFDVKYRIGEKGSFERLSTTNTAISVDGIKPGQKLEVQVRAVGIGFPVKKSDFAKAEEVAPSVASADVPVPAIKNLTVSPISDTQVNLQWTLPKAAKLFNLSAIIKHSSNTSGSGSFANSVKMAKVSASQDSVTVPNLKGEYIIKLQDQTTKQKSEEVSIILPTALPAP